MIRQKTYIHSCTRFLSLLSLEIHVQRTALFIYKRTKTSRYTENYICNLYLVGSTDLEFNIIKLYNPTNVAFKRGHLVHYNEVSPGVVYGKFDIRLQQNLFAWSSSHGSYPSFIGRLRIKN